MPTGHIHLSSALSAATYQVHYAVSAYLFLIRMNLAMHYWYVKNINLNISSTYIRGYTELLQSAQYLLFTVSWMRGKVWFLIIIKQKQNVITMLIMLF